MMSGLRAALADRLLVFAAHDLGLAQRWATRAIVLEAGVVIADGPPSTVLRQLPDGSPLRLGPPGGER